MQNSPILARFAVPTIRIARRIAGAVDPLWVGVLGYMIVVKLLLDAFFPNGIADPSQRSFFEWPSIAVIWIFGLIGITFARRAGFPAPLGPDVPRLIRWIAPPATGIAAALVFVAVDLEFHFTPTAASAAGIAQQFTTLPATFLAFTVAAIIAEVVFRLLPVPILFLPLNRLLGEQRREVTFRSVAVVTAPLEGILMLPVFVLQPWFILLFEFAGVFVVNFLGNVYFWRAGYLAPILQRLAFYLIWHVAYIH